jgi:hypothetical protein
VLPRGVLIAGCNLIPCHAWMRGDQVVLDVKITRKTGIAVK